VAGEGRYAGFLGQLTARGLVGALAGLDEPARQRPEPLVRMVTALHEQDGEQPGPDGEDGQVDRHRERREARRVVTAEELGLAGPALARAHRGSVLIVTSVLIFGLPEHKAMTERRRHHAPPAPDCGRGRGCQHDPSVPHI
jgi:hypothetical protein